MFLGELSKTGNFTFYKSIVVILNRYGIHKKYFKPKVRQVDKYAKFSKKETLDGYF